VINRFVVVVRTAQVDATVAFYRDVLGGEVTGAHGRATFLQLGPGVVEVLRDEAGSRTESTMLALEVASLDGWTDRLGAGGAPLLYGPIDLEGGGESLGTSDPNGVNVNLFTVP
jgi:catechol 2,3-dioxygenase-like lactoylglutathione lyase family enzyme